MTIRRMGLLRGLPEGGASIWDNYWYFNGVNSYLTMPHNADFDTPNEGRNTLIVGYRDEYAYTGIGHDSRLVAKTQVGSSTASSPPNGDFGMKLRGGTGLTRDASYFHHVGGGHHWKGCTVGDYLDGVDTCMLGARSGTPDSTFTFTYLDDVNGTGLLSCNAWTYGTDNFHGTSPLFIGAEQRTDAGYPTIRYYLKGRIYFVYWIKGMWVGGGWTTILCDPNDNRVPWTDPLYDPATYPTCLLKMEQAVGATYTPEIQSGPNAPYVFTVGGTPVLNGP